MAVQQYWGDAAEILACTTFPEVIRSAQNPIVADAGLMAIENSIAGSILPNYNLLKESRLRVTGEVYLEIAQHLLVHPGVAFDDILEVHSHPMAILQCLEFLDRHSWKIVATEDTALSAQAIRKQDLKHVAAIASILAADLFDLDIIRPDIHTMKHNYTRFLVLDREEEAQQAPDADKASVCFHITNEKGSLARILDLIADEGINLSKLQSFPIPGSNWLYSFHADMEFDNADRFLKAIERIQPCTEALKIYGIYKSGKLPVEGLLPGFSEKRISI